MAEVLQVPRTPDGQSFYQSSGLRRSHPSSSSLFIGSPALSSSSKSTPTLQQPAEHQERVTSPTLSIPVESEPTPPPTPDSPAPPTLSSLSLEEKFSNDDDFNFPDYNSFDTANSSSGDEPEASTTTDTTASDSPLPTPTVADDTAIKSEPKQHVDYLSHEWREEDIWSSWRHIVSQRKVYGQRSRLENASWRTWAKSKYHLRTISPETLNWLKESDVTWLYGPLKPAEKHPITLHQSEPSSNLSKSNSFVNKKPILKKRSMSEVMLQKSLSTSSLVKQAAAAVQAQGERIPRKSAFQRACSDFTASTTNSEAPSRDQIDYFTTSRSSSDSGTPCECQAKRHIRFDDKVEQCIAVECKEDPEDVEESESEDEQRERSSSDTSSDDGVVMMKRQHRKGKKKGGGGKSSSRSGSHDRQRKTIETLPSTTLKYRDSSDSNAAQQHHVFGMNWNSKRLSPSPSQETLRPSHPSSNFLIGDEDEDADVDMNSSWSFGASNPKSSLGAASPEGSSTNLFTRRDSVAVHKARSSGSNTTSPGGGDDEYGVDGLRRTNSGMLMPYDEDEDDMMAVGLFGRVSETINTAKDIAHVIWNVGWRK